MGKEIAVSQPYEFVNARLAENVLHGARYEQTLEKLHKGDITGIRKLQVEMVFKNSVWMTAVSYIFFLLVITVNGLVDSGSMGFFESFKSTLVLLGPALAGIPVLVHILNIFDVNDLKVQELRNSRVTSLANEARDSIETLRATKSWNDPEDFGGLDRFNLDEVLRDVATLESSANVAVVTYNLSENDDIDRIPAMQELSKLVDYMAEIAADFINLDKTLERATQEEAFKDTVLVGSVERARMALETNKVRIGMIEDSLGFGTKQLETGGN